MRKSNLERLRDAKKIKKNQVALAGIDDLFKLLLGGTPNPTQQKFAFGPEKIRGYMGAAGVAKTSTICGAAWMRALLVPGYKCFVSRNDYNDLMDTTMERMQSMLERLPPGTLMDRDKSPPMRWWVRPVGVSNETLSTPGDNDDLASTFTFLGINNSDLGSIEAHGWIVDEADEAEEKKALLIPTRLRAPALSELDRMALYAFNPPDTTHWLYTACTGENFEHRKVRDPWMTLYTPQPNENSHNLPPNYHADLAKTLPADMVQRLIKGEWGAVFPGQPVYREFSWPIHVRRDLIQKRNDHAVVIRFWDFGYNHPACVFAQLDEYGRLLCFAEVLGDKEEATPFASRVLARSSILFPHNVNFIDYGDPAVTQKKDTGSTLMELRKLGITMQYRTSKIEEGVNLIRRMLEQLVRGEPIIQLDAVGCPILARALAGGYHLDKAGLKPVKDGFYEHVADAFRYGCLLYTSPSPRDGATSRMPSSA